MNYYNSFVQILKTTTTQPQLQQSPTTNLDDDDEIKYTTDGNHTEKISKIPLRNQLSKVNTTIVADNGNGGGDDDDGGLIEKL